MFDLSCDPTQFIAEMDLAVEAHLGWTRRVMRCAVLRISPGEDALVDRGHELCRFGQWFSTQRMHFEKLDERNARAIEEVHHTMHDVIRRICTDVLEGRPGNVADLEIFERSQAELISLTAWFKTQFLVAAMSIDSLTGLPLRNGIEDAFSHIQKKCIRDHTCLYVAMIDIDHFKSINDSHGHGVGDAALRHVSALLKSALRPDEPVYRYGGEEFLWLMQCQSAEAAVVAAQRIVNCVRDAPLQLSPDQQIKMTVTLGLAEAKLVDGALGDAIERADNALYVGKSAGRDRYILLDD